MATVPTVPPPTSDADRWRAVIDRDAGADGRFVYAVTSTRIFCRPCCPSRRPARHRVRFFDTAEAARTAGFRACLRCRPLEMAADPWLARVRRACEYLTAADERVTLAALARRLGASPFHVQRTFTRLVGVSPRAFAEARRFEAVRRELRVQPDVTTAVAAAGYGSSSRFYERDASQLGMAPARYRSGGAGEDIRYVTIDAPIGCVLVAATPRGVCAVSIGNGALDVIAGLRAEFPRASVTEDGRGLRAWVAPVLAHLGGRLPRLDLPLDVRATAYQWQVWNALRAIPHGETRTYGEVAAAIGQPSSARAVARACASNPVALAIPCHRVVPASGGVGGYRWGIDRKRALVDAEQRRNRQRTED